jgi:hypothetical protein
MHPLIAASVSTQLSRERLAPRPRHPRRVTTRRSRSRSRSRFGLLHLRTS